MNTKLKLLVLASTYPRWANDHEPGFVHELSRRLTNQFNIRISTPHQRGALHLDLRNGVEIWRYRNSPHRLRIVIYDGGETVNIRRRLLNWLFLPIRFEALSFLTCRQVKVWRLRLLHGCSLRSWIWRYAWGRC